MSALNSIQESFFEECEELLEALASGLAQLQAGQGDAETMNAVFRAVHSIKGGAGAFALTRLVAFAHRFETVLDRVRSGQLTMDGDGYRVLQRAADHLADQVASAKTGFHLDEEASATVLEALSDFLPPEDGDGTADLDLGFVVIPLDLGPLDLGALDLGPLDPATGAAPPTHVIRFQPHAALFNNGHEPARLLRDLAGLGNLQARLVAPAAWPDWREMDLSTPLLSWEMTLTGEVERSAIDAVFDFVDGLCDLEIRRDTAEPSPAEADPPGAPDAAAPETKPGPDALPDPAPRPGFAPPPDGAAPSQPALVAAPDRPARPPGPKPADTYATSQTLRVDLDRVDRLINAVGELITNQAAIAQRVEEMALPTGSEVKTHVEDYRLLARDIQEAVMAIRAQPVKPLFQRMARIVREAADATGKRAELVTSGETVEVDKTVIECLADPLTHMIRNAVDHGLEQADDRLAAGKPAIGTVSLSASHRSGRVVITLRDDGAGLNRPRILEIARRKGLVPAEADLSDPEIDALLFMPGFSTAASISNLSGRGVGLDVVRTAVTALGGRLSIASVPGQGTEFTLSVPLTLAVMDGMVVSVGEQTMVVPVASVLETIRPEPRELNLLGTAQSLIAIRGRFIPVIDVARTLGLVSQHSDGGTPLLLLVETEDQSQYALAVDDVKDQRQIVIKGLDANYGAIAGVSAATVLGNGQVALILDTDALAGGYDLSGARNRPKSNSMEGLFHGSQ